jgi:hypothetical protein
VKRCDTVISAGLAGAILCALAGVVMATDTIQVLLYAVAGVWAGALGGGLIGAVACGLRPKRSVDRAGAGSDLRLESPKQLRPAGL